MMIFREHETKSELEQFANEENAFNFKITNKCCH